MGDHACLITCLSGEITGGRNHDDVWMGRNYRTYELMCQEANRRPGASAPGVAVEVVSLTPASARFKRPLLALKAVPRFDPRRRTRRAGTWCCGQSRCRPAYPA